MNTFALATGAVVVLVGIGVWVRHSGMRQHLGNILIPCTLIAACLILFVNTLGFPSGEGAGAAALPRLWIFLIIILCAIILGQVLRGKEKAVPRIQRKALLALVMAILIGYFVALPYVGYFLCTFLFIVLLLHLLSYPKKVFIFLIAGGWIIFSYFVFFKLLYIQLPLGVFEDLFY